MGLVFVPCSVHATRKKASPLAGLVNVAFTGFAPLFSLIALLNGSAPPVPAPSSADAPLISSLRPPLSSASKKNSLRSSAMSTPSQTAVNLPEDRKGVGGWPAST